MDWVFMEKYVNVVVFKMLCTAILEMTMTPPTVIYAPPGNEYV